MEYNPYKENMFMNFGNEECTCNYSNIFYEEHDCSEELYRKSNQLREEAKMKISESKVLKKEALIIKEKAYELERKSKEMLAHSNFIMDNAISLEKESNNKMELSSFYQQKYYEAYKNINKTCDEEYNYKNCKVSSGCTPKNL